MTTKRPLRAKATKKALEPGMAEVLQKGATVVAVRRMKATPKGVTIVLQPMNVAGASLLLDWLRANIVVLEER